MKVAELMKELEKFPADWDAEVYTYSDLVTVPAEDVWAHEPSKTVVIDG
jgi:hypothetical protein